MLPRSIRGTSRHRSNAARLARAVEPLPALGTMYPIASADRFAAACDSSRDRSVVISGLVSWNIPWT